MKSLTILCSLLLLSLAPSLSAAEERVDGLNRIVRAVHADLLSLKATEAWFSGYSDSNLAENLGRLSIRYQPPAAADGADQLADQRDHLTLDYIGVNNPRGLKRKNDFDNIVSCLFPTAGYKIYGQVIIHSAPALAERVKQIVIRHCQQEQADMRSSSAVH